ncbi:ArsC/Spx/MgsR family protein [Shimia sagamensis]|uniref:ArsC/Spx/MgsR family protein n=1 Tax=Shimia sagamensis TaxID=1566352 RepID=UPI0024B755F7|nr:ArsC/Spx/MgsR family protein [Shimia sagamensis]
MTLYGLKNCDTCRKVLKLLENANFIDVRSEGVPEETLKAAFEQFGAALANTRSTTWRNLSDEERAKPVLELLVEHPALMKRPLIEQGGVLYLGWDKATQAALI